jgi:hypothetical protein
VQRLSRWIVAPSIASQPLIRDRRALIAQRLISDNTVLIALFFISVMMRTCQEGIISFSHLASDNKKQNNP